MVIHIQDAHEKYEAQKNIASLIESLVQGEKKQIEKSVEEENGTSSTSPSSPIPSSPIVLVGVEGARGDFNFDPYRSFPNKITQDIAEYLLKESLIKSQGYLVEEHFQGKLKNPKFRHLYELESKKVNLGFVLHQLRTQHGYTQAELAERVGVTQGHIARVETAESANYEINTIKKIVNALNTILFIGFAEEKKDTHSLEVQQLVRY